MKPLSKYVPGVLGSCVFRVGGDIVFERVGIYSEQTLFRIDDLVWRRTSSRVVDDVYTAIVQSLEEVP